MRYKKLLNLLIHFSMIICFPNCQPKADLSNISPKDKFLFVGFPSTFGEANTSFGWKELFISDFYSKEVYRVTDNNYEEKNPCWYTDGSKIFFDAEISSEGNIPFSQIYFVNLKTSEIHKYQRLLKSDFKEILGYRNIRPVYSSNYQLAFVTIKKENEKHIDYLCIYDEIIDSLSIIDSATEMYWDYSFSYDSKYLFYSKLEDDFKTELGIINLSTKNKFVIHKNQKMKYHFISWYLKEDKILFQEGSERDSLHSLVSYNILDSQITKIGTAKNVNGTFEEIGESENIIFVNRKNELTNESNLWYYDLNKTLFTQLFDDNKRKSSINYFRKM